MPAIYETANMPPPTSKPMNARAETPIKTGLSQFTGAAPLPDPFFFLLDSGSLPADTEASASVASDSSSSSDTGIAASLSLAFRNAISSSSSAAGALTTKGFLHLGQGTRFPTELRLLSFRLA